CAFERRTRAQAHEGVLAVIHVVGGRALRQENVGAVRDIEITRRDAGNSRVEFGKVDRFADDRRVAVIKLLPQPCGDHDGRWWSWLRWGIGLWRWERHEVVVRKTPGGHRQAEQLEEPLGDGVELYV